MAAQDYALTTTARIKTRLDINVADYDTLLDGIVNAVTAFVENECGGRRFKRDTYTQELYDGGDEDGSRKTWLFLKHAPVTALTAFQYRTGSKTSPTWNDFDGDHYQEINEKGAIKVPSGLPRGYQNIRVTYTAGYLIDFDNYGTEGSHNLPYDLTDLAERLVVKIFKKREHEGQENIAFQDSTITWRQLLDESDKAIIANYRRAWFV